MLDSVKFVKRVVKYQGNISIYKEKKEIISSIMNSHKSRLMTFSVLS